MKRHQLYNSKTQELKALYVNQKVRRRSPAVRDPRSANELAWQVRAERDLAPNRYTAVPFFRMRFAANLDRITSF